MEPDALRRRYAELEARRDRMLAQAHVLSKERDDCLDQAHVLEGAMQDCSFWMERLAAGDGDVTPLRAEGTDD